jgi:superfamily I DNA/RNA helicase
MLVSLRRGRSGQPPADGPTPGQPSPGQPSPGEPSPCQPSPGEPSPGKQGPDGRCPDHPSLYRAKRDERGPATPEELLADLTPSQHLAVTATSPTVCVLASAGAGKTRVLTRRIGYRAVSGTADPGHVLAITFTRKAARELRERLDPLGLVRPVTAGTFHSLAISQLRRWWADRRSPEPALLERKGRLIAELVAGRPGLQDVGVGELASQLEWAKARLIEPDGFAAATSEAHRELPADAGTIAAFYSRYEDEKRRRRLVDFDDLLARYTGALETDSRFAAAQRWRWRHVFVDELQDVNPLQYRMLLALLGDNDDLFVVGDPNQAIYGWNGSDPAFLAGFPERWPMAELVHLDDNHRSSPQVVAAASSVLGRQATAVRSSRPDGPLPRLRCYPSEDAEAAGVAAQLLAARASGLHWAQMAVLVRANSQATNITQALRRAGVPLRAMVPADNHELRDEEPDDFIGMDAVTVCTFHRAKGLQWTSVWVCGLEAGFVPIAYASTAAALAEERRLLYVALSRAERELHCSWARQRRASNGAMLWREPSPWLRALAARCALPGGPHDESPPGLDAPPYLTKDGADGTRGTRSSPHGVPDDTMLEFLASARRRLARADDRRQPEGNDQADPSTLELAQRLTDWRRKLARASGVPAHVLMHDSTVTAIALRKPASEEELRSVPGLGAVKVARFGPAILEVVQAAKR